MAMLHAARVRAWLTGRALPLWASAGVDGTAGGFVERLDWTGAPELTAAKRTRVQARQIYVFAHAALIGLWPDGTALAEAGFEFLLRHAQPGGPGAPFVFSVSRTGAIVDHRSTGYDHAFLLFAFAWLYKANGERRVRDALDDVMTVIETRLALPDGGIAVDATRIGGREQNPNMHLLEALLAAAEATGDARFLESADRQVELFRNRLFDREHAVLREFYDERWRPTAGDRGLVVEPGHHCEWVWLLQRHAGVRRRPLPEEAAALFDTAVRAGRPDGVLLCDELTPDGRMRRADTRCWPQTEAIKAEIAMAEALGTPVAPRADALVEALFERFLDRPVAGGWIDRFDAAGAPAVTSIPASTFYHMFLAFSEYLRAAAHS